jgi:transcriptional regulator with XRE-family HTH domain
MRNARESLGMTQLQLGEAIGVTQKYISTLESPTNTKRLSRQKEATLIRIAGLPPRYFDEDNASIEHISTNEDIVYAMIPEVKDANLTISDVRAMLKPLASRKVSQ